jgi:uncharacterized protein (TIGR02444 family)
MSEAAHSRSGSADKSLWHFALAVYSGPNVADACLALQDHYGCDVNLLLFAAWLSAIHEHRLLPGEMSEAASAVRDWHGQVVRPLRSVRRRLKSGPPPAPGAACEALRGRIKSVEIEAERLELDVLENLAEKWPRTSDASEEEATLANLSAVLRHVSGSESEPGALQLLTIIANAANNVRSSPGF